MNRMYSFVLVENWHIIHLRPGDAFDSVAVIILFSLRAHCVAARLFVSPLLPVPNLDRHRRFRTGRQLTGSTSEMWCLSVSCPFLGVRIR